MLQMLLVVFGGITLTGMLAQALGYRTPASGIDYFSLALGAVSLHVAGLIWLDWFIRDHQLRWRSVLGLVRANAAGAIVKGFAVGVAGFFICNWLGSWIYLILQKFTVAAPSQVTIIALQSTPSLGWVVFFGIISILIAPVVEELVFRGILYPMIAQSGFPKTALWGTSLLFAATHANLLAFVPLTLLALLLALLYRHTDNLLAPILAHGTFNAINFGMTVLS